ncbi:hypothetical protein [Labrenzia sp. OB1]|uniref:hypothetical protein n=1 Tax=Labrenzia sp. OB1 TaxID=1561204 RepID=UPI0007B19638|nr:hypothetical protein [Labrenzia sp. OB1]KZM46957.1 hypothetical protein OA90_26555 [Labrenzia sp. OB1]
MLEERTIAELIDSAGGAEKIVEEANARELKLSKWGPYKWPSAGIPEKYWDIFADLAGTEPNEIYAANVAARQDTEGNVAA